MTTFNNFQIAAITACVPSNIEDNKDLPFDKTTLDKVIAKSGIRNRRISDKKTTAGDLCTTAANDILKAKHITSEDIKVLVFVTQYPDYILPSTVHIIKEKLGLDHSCIAIQLNEGCSGYIYGLQLILSLLQSSGAESGLLLVGDTPSKVISQDDTSTRPLFGDAGTATLIKKGAGSINVELGSDGVGFKDIIVENGGFRNQDELNNLPRLKMDGMNVFMFGISRVPKFIMKFCESTNTDLSQVDYIILHQANKMMTDRIIRKLKIPEEKAVYSLHDYGNTSSASIPLTMASQLKDKVNRRIKILASGFGVGLSWGTCTFEIDQNCLLNTIEY